MREIYFIQLQLINDSVETFNIDDIEVDTHVNDDSGVDVVDIVDNEPVLQQIKNGVKTFNFDPLISYTTMLQEVDEEQPLLWITNIRGCGGLLYFTWMCTFVAGLKS